MKISEETALAAPIHVVHVEDHRELVEHQGGADSEQDPGDLAPDAVLPGSQRKDAADQQDDQAGHHVMDVDLPAGDVAERTLARPDQAGDRACHQECDEEGQERQEHGLPSGLDDLPVVPVQHRPSVGGARHERWVNCRDVRRWLP